MTFAGKLKSDWKTVLLGGVYVTGILIMFILPFFSLTGYSIISNTLSDLGAQSTPNAWIMNSVLIIIAVSSVITVWEYFDGFVLHRILLVVFASSLTLLAFLNDSPVDHDINNNIREAGWHHYFAGTAVLSFTILSLATSFVLEKQLERALSMGAGILIIFLAVLMSEAERYSGVWQRLIFIIVFGWLIYILKVREQ